MIRIAFLSRNSQHMFIVDSTSTLLLLFFFNKDLFFKNTCLMKCFKFYFPCYFCLGWISVASHGLSPVVVSGGYSSFSARGDVPASSWLMRVFSQSVVYRWRASEQLGGFIKNVEFTPELKILAGRNLHLQKILKAHYNLNIIESIKMSMDDSCTELEKRTVNDFRQSEWVT